ncbi:hypothetical protein BKA70DRAFT_1218486 [Coprinopsis sp. MPI-PUGE-AT-0042]|nr:hypothetical protein BKA70DRAFT_1218486 [Coprinopsis sp. MPI-PUGE-AT-0042]
MHQRQKDELEDCDNRIEHLLEKTQELAKKHGDGTELFKCIDELQDTIVMHNALVWALSPKYPEWNLKPFDDKILQAVHRGLAAQRCFQVRALRDLSAAFRFALSATFHLLSDVSAALTSFLSPFPTGFSYLPAWLSLTENDVMHDVGSR